jgi:hypothetical protein
MDVARVRLMRVTSRERADTGGVGCASAGSLMLVARCKGPRPQRRWRNDTH